MSLYTKSIQAPVSADDGIRICVMCKPTQNSCWDMWMPKLAPSLVLLELYNNSAIDWEGYVQQFHQEVLVGAREHIDLLVEISRTHTITILCWEETPKKCHRRLLAEFCKEIATDLPVIIR